VSGVWAVLVAAGRGERFGGDRPKAFAKLRGRVLLAESLERLEHSDWIEAIVIVAPVGWEEPSILLAEELSAGKVSSCVSGGTTRAESVRVGVAEVPDDVPVILVHDAARPLLPETVTERVIAALGDGWDGAVPALPVSDTIKRAGKDGAVLETLDRSGLVAVQTPQAFASAPLRVALGGNLAGVTDCATLVEAGGGRVRVVDGDPRLLKVTTQSDLALVETLLASE
jgi:2-C-methyl-D-erythritol 4-phosphate cytidylyltransferase